MNSTAPMPNKTTGRLAETRMGASSMTDKKRAPTATTSKAIGKSHQGTSCSHKLCLGLTDEMLNAIQEDEEMQYLMRLNGSVKKVKSSNSENSQKINELDTLFKELHEIIARVQKAQSKSATAVQDKKKEDPKKGKK